MDSEGNDPISTVNTEHPEIEVQDDRGSNNSGSHSSDEFVKVNQDDASLAEDASAAEHLADELESTTPAVSEITSKDVGGTLLDRLDPREAEVPSQDKTEQSVVAQVSHMASEYEETDALKSADDNEFEPEDDPIMLVKDEPEVKEEVEEEEDLEPPAVTPIPEPEIVDAAEVPPVVEEIETKPQPKTCDESLVPASVIDLIYWRDIKKSAFVFSFLMLILTSLTVFSVISVISYTGLALLTVTVAFRLYKLVLQTLNGTQQPHPFQELLDTDMTLSSEQVHKYTDAVLCHVNCILTSARGLLLVQNTVSSIKLGVFLWLMTYIGCCFNGLTLLIIDVVLVFTVPPLYEKYQTQIDTHYKLAREKIAIVLAAVKARIPGAKEKTQ